MEAPQKEQRHPIKSKNHHQQLSSSSPFIVASSTSGNIGPNDSGGDGTDRRRYRSVPKMKRKMKRTMKRKMERKMERTMERCENCGYHSSECSKRPRTWHGVSVCKKCSQRFNKLQKSRPEELECKSDCKPLEPNDNGKYNFGANRHEAEELGIKKCCKYKHFIKVFDPNYGRPFSDPDRKQQQQQSQRRRLRTAPPLISARKGKKRKQKENDDGTTIGQIDARTEQDSTGSNSREAANSHAVVAAHAGEGVNTFVPARLISVDGINVLVLNIEQLNIGEQQQQSSSRLFFQLVNGNQRQFLYTEFQCTNAWESKKRLTDDLDYLMGLGGFSEHENIKDRLLTMINELHPYLFEDDGANYHSERRCSCGPLTTNGRTADANARYHALFDFLINIGWIDPIDGAEANSNRIAICDAGRGIDANGFNYLMNANKLNAQPVQMEKLREIAQQFAIGPAAVAPFKDPSQCEHCNGQFARNSAHVISNLLINFGLCSIGELRPYSTCNCTFEKFPLSAQKGVPIRARDLVDFCIHTDQFMVYGPENVNIPPNAHRNRTTTHIDVIDARQLDKNTLCFAFCHRRTEKSSTIGNAMYFGTRNRCYAGTATFSDSKFDRWFFVPKVWHQSYSSLPYRLGPIQQQQHPHHQQYAISAGGSAAVEVAPISGDHHCSANMFNPQQSTSTAGHYANVNNAWPLEVAAAAQTYGLSHDDHYHDHYHQHHHQPVHLQQQQHQFEPNNRRLATTAAPPYDNAVTNAIASAALPPPPPIYYDYEQQQWPSSSSSWSSSSSSN